jgi:Ca2+-binding RTX toxin-like protein
MATVTVSSATADRRAGDTIQLAPGGYGVVWIDGARIAGGEVVITSADPNAPAVIEFLNVRNAQGLTFRQVEIGMEAGGGQGVRISSSSDIRLDDLDIHGVLDGDPSYDGTGVLVENSTNVTVAGSDFHDLTSGIGHSNTHGLTISDNDFRLLRMDGIAGSESSDMRVSGNYFTDFFPLVGDHADAIQFWQTSQTVTTNITVNDNVIVRGAGAKIQGIFMTASTVGYRDMVISGNAVVGGMYHGITVAKVTNLDITDNLVVGYDDLISWILVQDSDDVLVANNQATAITVTGPGTNNTNLVQFGNVIVAQPQIGDLSLLASWTLLDGAVGGLRIDGTAGADTLTGGTASDTIFGGDGADLLDGALGSDQLVGGTGNDAYFVDSVGDVVIEAVSAGDDLINSSVTYVLPVNVERLTLTGSAAIDGTGNALANLITGNSAGNRLSGAAGADTLQGMAGADTLVGGDGADRLIGGTGVDRMEGGAGDDYYVIDLAGDLAVETLTGTTGGVDQVYSHVSFTLGANLENLQLGSSQPIYGIGNELANYLLGNGAANRLEGRAGADTLNGVGGDDVLIGGAGSDLLIGGAGNDHFLLARGEAGGDRIQDFALGDRIELTGYSAGSTFVRVAGSTTDWAIRDAGTGQTEIIKLLNGYVLGAGDFLFV